MSIDTFKMSPQRVLRKLICRRTEPHTTQGAGELWRQLWADTHLLLETSPHLSPFQLLKVEHVIIWAMEHVTLRNQTCRRAGPQENAGGLWTRVGLTHLLVACLLYNLLPFNLSEHKMYDYQMGGYGEKH